MCDCAWVEPEGTSMLYEKVAQMPQSHSCHTTFFLLTYICWPQKKFFTIRCKEREDLVLGYRMDCVTCQHHLRIESCSTTSLFWESGERKSSQWIELQAACTCFFIFPGWRNGQVCDYRPIYIPNGLAGRSRTWKVQDRKTGYEEVTLWGRGMWLTSTTGEKKKQNMQTFSVPNECPSKGDLSRGGF